MNDIADGLFEGLDLASLSDAPVEGAALELPLGAIQPDPDQPRKAFDKEALKELAASIKQQGVIQPVIVHKVGDKYQLIAGERRLRASKLAKLKTIPAIVREPMDDYAQVIENESRENLTALELAAFIAKKHKGGKGEQLKAIARKLGKPASIITEYNKLNDVPEAIRKALESGRLKSARTANDLMKLYETHDTQSLDDQIAGMAEVKRSDVPKLEKSTPSSSRRSAAKKDDAKAKAKPTKKRKVTKPLSTQDIKAIEKLKPVIRVVSGRRHGCVAFNVKARSTKNVWIRFDDNENSIEQVAASELKLVGISS